MFRIVRNTLLYLASWIPLGILFAAMMHAGGFAGTWPVAFLYATTYLAPAVFLVFPVIALARRFINQGISGSRLIRIHLGFALLFTALWHGAFYAYLSALGGWAAVRAAAGNWWPWQLTYGAFFYGIVVGIISTIQSNRRRREGDIATARADALRVRAEMQALRGQLDPHFLFNTLHSITALVRLDPPRAEEALVQFGALLRRVLDWKREGTDEVTLAEEMRFIDDCLALERLRLGERLRVEQHLSAEALACYLPVLSVQPLVENAIRHAIAPQRAGGVITLSATISGRQLKVIVADNGPGADPAAVAAATGTGLTAIRQRLQLRHGNDAALAVDTAPGRGFTITLSLPVVTEPILNAIS